MNSLMNFFLVIALSLFLNTKLQAQEEESEGDSSITRTHTFNPDGSDTIEASGTVDDVVMHATSHKDAEGNITETGTSTDFEAQRAVYTTRTNVNNPDFDRNSQINPEEIDENDESRSGVAVFHPDGSSLSQTKVKRADGGEDTEIVVQGVDGSDVVQTAEKSLKALGK